MILTVAVIWETYFTRGYCLIKIGEIISKSDNFLHLTYFNVKIDATLHVPVRNALEVLLLGKLKDMVSITTS